MILNKIVYGVLSSPPRARHMVAWLRERGIPGEAVELADAHDHIPLAMLPLSATQYVRGALLGAAFVGGFSMLVGLGVAYLVNGPQVMAAGGTLVALGLIGAAFGAVAGVLSYGTIRKRRLRELEDEVDDGFVVLAQTGPVESIRVESELIDRGATLVGTT